MLRGSSESQAHHWKSSLPPFLRFGVPEELRLTVKLNGLSNRCLGFGTLRYEFASVPRRITPLQKEVRMQVSKQSFRRVTLATMKVSIRRRIITSSV